MRKGLQQFVRSIAVVAIALLSSAPLAFAAWPKPGDVLVLTASFDGSHRHEYLFAVDPASKTRTFIVDFSTFNDAELGPFHASPVEAAAAPDGSIWAIYHNVGLSTSAGVVVKVNADGSHKVMTVFGPSIFLSGIAIGADGAVYVVSNGSTLAGLFRIDSTTGSAIPLVLNTAAVDPDCTTTVCPPIQFRDASGLAVDAAGDILLGDIEGGVLLSAATLCQQLHDCGALYRIHPGSPFVMNNPASQYNGQTVVAATETLISDFDNPAKGPIGNDAGGVVALGTDGAFLVSDNSRWFTYGQAGDPCLGNTFPAECNILGTLFRVYPDGTRTALSVFGDQTQGQTGGVSSLTSPVPVTVVADGTILLGACTGGGSIPAGAICSVDPVTGFRTLWSDFGVHQSIGGIDVQLLGVDALAVAPGFQAAATTTVTSSLNPSAYGQSVNFIANVTSNVAATPTGSVTFQDGGTTLATVTLAAGTATFTTTALTAGTHPITAAYSGDSSFPSGVSAAVSQVVNRAATSTTLTSNLNPAVAGAAITFTANVTPASGSGPTGTVTFYDGATTIGTATVAAGAASLTLNTLANGNHSITAAYAGDTNFNASTSAAVNEAIGAMTDLAIALAATPPSVTRTTNTTLNVTVTNNGPLNATSVVARLALPGGLTFVSANPAAAYASATGLWIVGNLPSGASATLQVVATLNATSVSVSASIVSADQSDANLANNVATITINEAAINVGGACDLRNAIIAANTDAPSGGCPAGQPGLDTIYLQANSTVEYADVFETPTGIGPDELPAVTSPIVIEGRGSVVRRALLPGTPNMRVFYVAKGGALTLHNVMVTNGAASGGGGGVLLQGAGASVVVDASQIVGNLGTIGGGICSGFSVGDDGDIVIRNRSLVAANTAFDGGGVAAGAGLTISTTSTIGSGNIAGTNYGGNTAFSDGGGVYTTGNASITSSFIHDNTAGTKGGGIVNDGTLTLDTAQIYANKSTVAGPGSGLGAGLLTGRFGTTTVTNSRIFNNTGVDGGGVWNSHVTTLTDTDVFNNQAQTGGGIENAGLLNLLRGSINQNSATSQGGGIANLFVNDLGATAALVADSTSITNNTSNVYGGGIVNVGAATLTNVTVAGNRSDIFVGGIANYPGATLNFVHGTIRGNAGGTGGIYVFGQSIADIRDSVIAANTSGATAGGLAVAGTAILTNTIVGGPTPADGNIAAKTGGGILVVGDNPAVGTDGTLVMNGGAVENNVANGTLADGGGGGLANSPTQYTGAMTLNGVTVANNRAPNAAGGGLYLGGINGTNLTLNGGTVSGNSATEGGGLSIGNDAGSFGSIAVFGTAFSNNVATSGGGGAAYVTGRLYMVNGSMTANRAATNGGGIAGRSGSIDITNVTLDGNTAGTSGGGIYAAGAINAINVRGGAVRSNTAIDGGGIYSISPALVIDTGALIESNTATHSGATVGGGGGLFLSNGTSVSNAVIRNNTAPQAIGGGILNFVVLRIDDSSITGNTAKDGAGIANGDTSSVSPSASATLNNVTLATNTASRVGGGIANAGTLNVNGGTVNHNQATDGGGISTGSGFALTNVGIDANSAAFGGNVFAVGIGAITTSTISNGSATLQGGNMWVATGPVTIDGVDIRGGAAANGAGIYVGIGAQAIVRNGTVIESNFATAGAVPLPYWGGGVYVDRSGSFSISDSIIRNNFAGVGAGMLLADANATITNTTISGQFGGNNIDLETLSGTGARATIDRSAIINNNVVQGSAVDVWGKSVAVVTNTTISGNTGLGTVLSQGGGTIQLSSSTVVNNTEAVSPGVPSAAVIAAGPASIGTISVDNSIVLGNPQGAGFADCLLVTPGSLQSLGHNLFGAASTGPCPLTVSDRLAGDAALFSDILAPLANNGGATLTHPLLPGSPALDNGAPVGAGVPPACLATDQRGLPRPQDATGFGPRCDIGAYEQQTRLIAPLRLKSLTPSGARSGIGPLTMTLLGTGFVPGSVVNWNGAPLLTTVVDQSSISAVVPAADLALPGDLNVVLITVRNPDGTVSNAQAFTVASANVAAIVSGVVAPGTTSSAFGIVPGSAGAVGISATYVNNTPASDPAIVTVATYKNNPVGGSVFDIGGKFADLRVAGADPTDSMTANFYYPTSIAGAVELGLQLTYWNGAAWAPVLSSGGLPPVKNTTNNLDGTTSGGRFTVIFDQTSTPKLTDLHGTVFMIAPHEAALGFDPGTRDLVVLDRFGAAASITSTPATWGGDDDPNSNDTGPAELRTYVLGSDPATAVTMVVKVKKAGQEIKAHVLSVQHGIDAADAAPQNLLNVQWSPQPPGSIKQLEQKIAIGAGSDRQDIDAKYDATKNQTTIDNRGQPGHVVEPGMVLLRTVSSGNTIVTDGP